MNYSVLARKTRLFVVVAATASLGRALPAQSVLRSTSLDSTAVVRTVEQFQHALISGDSAGALALLADSALILESGDLETRSDYRAHHLAADVEFARAVASERHVERVTVVGDAAWMIATSHARGTFRGRDIDSLGAEIIVLRRLAAGWRIAAIHWSSHRASGRTGS